MRSRLIAAGAIVVLYALPLVVALAPIDSGDAWWHLAVGEWMLEHSSFIEAEPFSHTAAGHEFAPQEWASQIAFAFAHRAGGLLGVRLLTAALLLAGAGLIWQFASRRQFGFGRCCLLVGLTAPAMAYLVEPRPHMFSWVFFGFLAHWMLGRRTGFVSTGRALAGGLLLGALWANFHAVAVLGLIVAGATLADVYFRSDCGEGTGDRRAELAPRGAFTAAFAVGLLLNPQGWGIFAYAFGNIGVATAVINEWQPFWMAEAPVSFAGWAVAIGAALAIVLALIALVRMWTTRNGYGLFETLGLSYMLLSARRWLWLGWVPAFHGLRHLPESKKLLPVYGGIALALAALPLMHPRTEKALRASTWERPEANRFNQPLGSADFLESLELEGNLYHPYLWGGYFVYRLAPAWKVYLYGETAVFMESGILQERQQVEFGPEDAAIAKLREREVRAAVLPKFGADGKLSKPPGGDGPQGMWIRAFANQREALWLRRDDAQALAAAKLYYASHGIAWHTTWGYLEHAALLGNLEWFEANDQVARTSLPALETMRKALLQNPAAPAARSDLTGYLQRAGFRRSARAFEEEAP